MAMASLSGSSETSSKRPKSSGSSSCQEATDISFFLTSLTVSFGERSTAMDAEEYELGSDPGGPIMSPTPIKICEKKRG